MRCKGYVGIACVDGSCPIANRDEYIEYGIPAVWSCEDCHMYKGCEYCGFCDENNQCDLDMRKKVD